MQHDTIRDQMRRSIVEKSVQILRGHGKSDEEIRSMILNDRSDRPWDAKERIVECL